MPKDYSKLLIELKPMLPRGYQRKIFESLADVEEWHVKWAFSERQIQLELLKKIYKKSAVLARKEQRQLATANREVSALKKGRRKVS